MSIMYRIQKVYKQNHFNRVSTKTIDSIDKVKQDIDKLLDRSTNYQLLNNKLIINTRTSIIEYTIVSNNLNLQTLLHNN